MDALAFLDRKKATLEPLYVLPGDEAFLKRRVLRVLRDLALGEDADESALSTHAGDKATFAAVWDELESLPFFGPRRLVVVENGDPFVTRFRTALEKKFESGRLPATGVLVLDVKAWPSNTRLAKMVADARTIVCKSPAAYKLPQWACAWAASQYQKQMPPAAGQLLLDLVGPDMGLLDQELLKVAIYVGDRPGISEEDIDRLVGNSRAENTWKIFDLLGQGKTADALRLLQRLLEQGEEPMRILGAFGLQLRKLGQAARLVTVQRMSMNAALAQVGIPPFGLASAEQQLRKLGRRRGLRLYSLLLELNLDLRGNSPLSEAILLERFLLRLASQEA